MKFFQALFFVLVLSTYGSTAYAADHSSDADKEKKDEPFAGLALRHIGPAITSGRISDFAFHPEHKNVFYAATASGNLWKTTNNTITWEPLFENEGSYSIGVVEIDPSNPLTLWVGTGENNAQRSVAFGDGIYRSDDGGKTWKNMGLKESGHISQIWIHPEDSDTVLAAAQGPLWNSGGDRGLYKTTDGGENWKRILEIDEDTGVNEFVVDPRNPDVIVASSYQRRRHVWVLINGGPGSGVHKSTDGGETWDIVKAGLPSKDHTGRIGLAMAPSSPDTLYAIIEGSDDEKGVYRSMDFGTNWEKRSGHMTSSPQYYNEIIVDPHNADRLYSVDTFTHKSEDGGKTFEKLSTKFRHVDDHALWIDPEDTKHLYIGGDGGIYESWDRGQTWRHVRNLSITQFYRIAADDAKPFYNVCGGTQDNNSLCAPSRTTVVHGITNSDWNMVLGGDGYKPQIDPTDPNTIYAQYQYGGLARYDRRTQERIYITPHPKSGETRYKWNWNTPLLISPHKPRRLYYAAEKVFRSDDRGDTWRVISPDLTRQLDRNELEVMGRVWSVDSVAKNDSTSMYGSIIGLSESPVVEDLLYVGTDDGLISVSEDGGENWRTTKSFPKVPDMSYIDDVVASVHDEDVVFAVFDNHKRGDHAPYVVRSDDRGKTWTSITGDLPERGSAHTIAEDHVDPNLLFVGTEFGLFFSQDKGGSWHALKGNFPTIAVRDLEIQRRESDLIVGTFGRGIYILDDYSPLRTPADDLATTPATLMPVRDAWLYVEGDLWDNREKGSMGSGFFAAPNPAFGAVFSYYLSDDVRTQKQERRKKELLAEKEGGDTPYPKWETLRAEDREDGAQLALIVRDAKGAIVSRVAAETKKGLHRTAWNLRYPASDPVNLNPPANPPYWVTPPVGPFALPGKYTVTLAMLGDSGFKDLTEAQAFSVVSLEASPEITSDRGALLAFQNEASQLRRAVTGATGLAGEMQLRIDHLKAALHATVAATDVHFSQLKGLESRLDDLNVALSGDSTIASRNEPTAWSIASRIDAVFYGQIESQSDVPGLYTESLEIARTEFAGAQRALQSLSNDLASFEMKIEELGAPWTPGRTPVWSPQ
ncbi:MAG: WD40/YVTN/BNR-like repeat-containing protein [Gammaproteobacteria bacterium]